METACGRINNTGRSNFEALRVLAAVLVIYGNGLVLTGQPGSAYWGAPFPRIGLDICFAISGYLAFDSWQRRPTLMRYLARRALRIFPGLAACVVATILVLGPLATHLSLRAYLTDPMTRHYLANMLLVQQLWLPRVFEGQQWVGTVNPMLWTLVAGVLCLLSVPVFARMPPRARSWALLSCTGMCAAAVIVWPLTGTTAGLHLFRVSMMDMLTEAPFFLAAAWLRCVTRDSGERFFRADLAMLCFAANWVVATWLGGWNIVLEWATMPYMVISFGRLSMPALGRFGRLGNPSYGVYLYAFPLQQLIVERLPGNAWPILTCVALALPIGFLSWYLIERPALRWAGPSMPLWRMAGRKALRGVP